MAERREPADWRVAVVLIAMTVGSWLLFVLNRAPGTDAALRGFPLDDGWIHMVYARSLVTEGGFHYNTGVPEAGMTSPLWVVLLAGADAILGTTSEAAARAVVGAKALSLAFGIGGVLALRGLARDLGESKPIAFLAAALAALDPSLTFSRAAGMEVPLFVFLVLVALRGALAGRPILTGALAGLSVVARPEGLVLFPIYAALLLRRAVRARPGAGGRLAAAALLAALPALAYSAHCLSAVGTPLPNTFYAKFRPQSPLSLDYLLFGWRNYVRGNLPYFTLEAGTVLAALGAVRIVRRGRLTGLAPLAAGAGLFVSALASRVFAPNHYFYWERWLIPAFPFLLVAVASGIAEILAGFASLRPGVQARAPRPPSRAWRSAAIAAVALVTWRLPAALAERASVFAWNAQNIEEMNVQIGRWVGENLPKDAIVAVNDAGALRYFGGRTTIDLLGLNDHRILRRDPNRGIEPLLERGVDYFAIFPSWFPDFVNLLPLKPIHSVRSPHYTICEGPQDLIIVYRLEKP
jgi:hypothetical protein